MTTKYDNLTPEVFATEVARVLIPGPYEHVAAQSIAEMEHSHYHCANCKEDMFDVRHPCPIPDPLTLDMNTAMAMFRGSWISQGITVAHDYDKANQVFRQVKPGMYRAMLCSYELYKIFLAWVATPASPRDILTICMLALCLNGPQRRLSGK